jgi:hypothetical protein
MEGFFFRQRRKVFMLLFFFEKIKIKIFGWRIKIMNKTPVFFFALLKPVQK